MAYSNWVTQTLRASAATSGANEQDAAVTLPETVTEFWAVMDKTAEANADNLLTVRLQSYVDGVWFDIAWNAVTTSAATSAAVDGATSFVGVSNIVESNSVGPAITVMVHYNRFPSNVIRVISISSGTAVANTFSVTAHYQLNRF